MTIGVAVLVSSILSLPAAADRSTSAGQCYTITDPDQRAACRAREHKESGMCYSIQRQDMQGQCMAETHGR